MPEESNTWETIKQGFIMLIIIAVLLAFGAVVMKAYHDFKKVDGCREYCYYAENKYYKTVDENMTIACKCTSHHEIYENKGYNKTGYPPEL